MNNDTNTATEIAGTHADAKRPLVSRPTHPQLVERLCKKPEALLAEWTKDPRKVHLLHMASKLVSEANEVAECIYAHVFYDKPLDLHGKDGMIKEFGDMEFYAEGIRAPLELDRQAILEANIDKLLKRYGDNFTYSNEAAIARVDKNEPSDWYSEHPNRDKGRHTPHS